MALFCVSCLLLIVFGSYAEAAKESRGFAMAEA